MLNVSKRLSLFPLKLVSSKNATTALNAVRMLSSVASEPASVGGVFAKSQFSTNDLFTKVFSSTGKNIQDVRVGGYVPVSEEDMALFPEGLSGEVLQEFELTNKPAWMIRDSGKLVCRILDDFKQRAEGGDITPTKGVSRVVSVPKLTDRKEWDKARMSVTSFGKSLTEGVKDADPDALTVPTMGEGSVVEKIITNMKANATPIPAKIMLTGDRGVGKSMVINQAVAHARKSGWLVLFVPRGNDQSQGGLYIEPVANQVPGGPKLYDNILMSTDLLRGFWRAHGDKLRQIPLRHTKYFDKYAAHQKKFAEEWARATSIPGRERMKFMELRSIVDQELNNAEEDQEDADVLARFDYRRFKPETLEDLLVFGVAFRNLAGQVFMDLVEELKAVEKFPVLIAVDEYNSWEIPSAYHYQNEEVHSKQLCVPHALRMLPDMDNHKKVVPVDFELKNGICLMATCQKYATSDKVTYDRGFRKHLPFAINVPHYSQLEFLASVCNYSANEAVTPDLSVEDVLAYRMQTASNPRVARLEAIPFFFPLAVQRDTAKMTAGDATVETLVKSAREISNERRKQLTKKGYSERDAKVLMREEARDAKNDKIARGEIRVKKVPNRVVLDLNDPYPDTAMAAYDDDEEEEDYHGEEEDEEEAGQGEQRSAEEDLDAIVEKFRLSRARKL